VLEQAAGRLCAGRINGLAILVNVLDHAILVNNEGRAVGEVVFFVQDAVILGDRPLEVAQERELEAVLLGEDVVGW